MRDTASSADTTFDIYSLVYAQIPGNFRYRTAGAYHQLHSLVLYPWVYFLRACPTSGSLLVDHRATSDGAYETSGVQPFAHGLPRRAVAAIAVQYLEKIFQVVLTLPSLATSGYVSLVDSLINPQAEASRTGLVRDASQQLLDTALEAVRDVPNKGADQRGCGRGATHFQPSSTPAGGSRAARASRTALRAAPTRTAPRCIDTYAVGP